MPSIVHYTQCPVCASSEIGEMLRAKDYTVSGNFFLIMECNQCKLRFTQDVPDMEAIGAYYQSANYISHTDTSKGLVNNLYQRIRKRTLRQKRRLVSNVTGLHNGSVLDVGSGTGAFVREMSGHGWQTTGLEPDEGARKVAQEQFNCHLKNSAELFQLPDASFDAITLWHVLEHVHELQVYILQLKKLLKDNGRILIAVPNYTSHDANAYREYWAAYDVPRHLYHFSPQAMKWLMEKNELEIIDWRPMWFDSFYVSLLSSGYKHPKTNWLGAVWTGLLSNLNAIGNHKKCSSVIYIITK